MSQGVILIKEHRDHRVKGRYCADGRKKCEKSNKKDTSSLTVINESVLITAAIEAFEQRVIVVTDTP